MEHIICTRVHPKIYIPQEIRHDVGFIKQLGELKAYEYRTATGALLAVECRDGIGLRHTLGSKQEGVDVLLPRVEADYPNERIFFTGRKGWARPLRDRGFIVLPIEGSELFKFIKPGADA